MSRLQLTLALLKPDISLNENAVSSIRKIMIDEKFLFLKTKFTKLTLGQAKQFYKDHEKKFFYNRLVYSMSSGPIWCHILARENAIKHWRKLLGPTKVFKQQNLRTIYEEPDSIRGLYGITDTRNTVHGSDSDLNAQSEIEFFFPEFNVKQWYLNEEKLFNNESKTYLDLKSFEHKLIQE